VLDPTPDISAEQFIKYVFLDSDTDMMVLTFIPSMSDAEPLTIEEAAATQKIIDDLEGTKRLLIHGRVAPNQAGDLDRVEHLAKKYGVMGWKTYTQWGPADNAYYSLQTGLGYELDDDRYGTPFIERARATGIRNICIQKGIPFGRDASYKYARCDDIGRAAREFPDMNFQLRDRHGYPEITPQLRATVFGLNATRPYRISAEEVKLRSANDRIGRKRVGYREDPDPLFLTYGPNTRREFLNLLSWRGGKPGD
jgi:hypothetical protein